MANEVYIEKANFPSNPAHFQTFNWSKQQPWFHSNNNSDSATKCLTILISVQATTATIQREWNSFKSIFLQYSHSEIREFKFEHHVSLLPVPLLFYQTFWPISRQKQHTPTSFYHPFRQDKITFSGFEGHCHNKNVSNDFQESVESLWHLLWLLCHGGGCLVILIMCLGQCQVSAWSWAPPLTVTKPIDQLMSADSTRTHISLETC